jgi:hypothetical protein
LLELLPLPGQDVTALLQLSQLMSLFVNILPEIDDFGREQTLYLFLHAGSQLSFFGGQLAFSPFALLLDAEAFLDGLN